MTNAEWLDEIEEVLDDLRERRDRIRREVDDRDLEAEAIFETCADRSFKPRFRHRRYVRF